MRFPPMDREKTYRRVLVALVLVFGLTACGGTEREFETALSPDGAYELSITVTEPSLPHARHVVTVYVKSAEADRRHELIKTKLANDGVPFTSRNIGLRWTGATTALVCLRPTDLPDRAVHVNVAKTPSAEIKQGC